jgi:cation diffusion facilitator CzcD-associated flavoprotein CzcO
MKDWVIVGGGIQGVTLAAFLLRRKKASVEGLSIIDPHDEPLSNWKHCTAAISMPYLRSPSVHHIDDGPFCLQSYVKDSKTKGAFFGRYKRPSLTLFNEHSRHVIKETGIREAWMQGRVKEAMKIEQGWSVSLQDGNTIETKNLAIAIGIGEQPLLPEWAAKMKEDGCPSVYHIFEKGIPDLSQLKGPFTVLGGGITAVHLAISLSSRFPGQVTLLKRHPFRVHDFDSDPGWLGPKNQIGFRRLRSLKERRQQIKEARNKGSIPFDLLAKIKHLVNEKKLEIVDGDIQKAEWRGETIEMFNKEGLLHKTRKVLLATGFHAGLPGKEWLPSFIEKHSLPCAECGYPIVAHSLQWSPGLYVTGALAELEIGPIARNISGARQAAERITSCYYEF